MNPEHHISFRWSVLLQMLEQGATGDPGSPVGEELRDFASFFDDEYRRLFHAMVLVCGDRAEAEDVAQEAFVKILERWESVRSMESPTAYVYRTALNEWRSRLRRILRRGRRSLFVRGGVDDTAEHAIARAEVNRGLRTPTIDQRAALVLVEFVGMSSQEAGESLGVEATAVRARVHRARESLREEWSEDA